MFPTILNPCSGHLVQSMIPSLGSPPVQLVQRALSWLEVTDFALGLSRHSKELVQVQSAATVEPELQRKRKKGHLEEE